MRPFEDVAGEPETHVGPFALYQEHTSAGSYETFGAHEEHRLESNVIGEIRRILPTIDVRHIYPQVPSFVGEERNVIDLLTITMDGRLVVIEWKASGSRPSVSGVGLLDRGRTAPESGREMAIVQGPGCATKIRCCFGRSLARVPQDVGAADGLAARRCAADRNRVEPDMDDGNQGLAPPRDARLG